MQELNIILDFNLQIEMNYCYESFWRYQKPRVQDLIEQFDLQVSWISMMTNTYSENALINMCFGGANLRYKREVYGNEK
jgi:hypothetical protein